MGCSTVVTLTRSCTLTIHIANHKAEAGNGMKLKPSFWSGAAKEMVLHSALGGMKTSQGCSSKWDWVCTNYLRQSFY
jgi:hypothetical protein